MIARNPLLQLLKHEAGDDRFLEIFEEFARILRRSEALCEHAERNGPEDFAHLVIDGEADYVEEIIGASFVVLQTKIRRVTFAAERLRSQLLSQHSIDIPELERGRAIKIGGSYKRKRASLIELIWDMGNYYKHRDEWPAAVWRNPRKRDRHGQSRKTRKSVQRLGIKMSSTGNMRAAYEFFGIDPYSDCEKLARQVQAWAEQLYELAQKQLKAKAHTVPPVALKKRL